MKSRICICDGMMHPSWLIQGGRCPACGVEIDLTGRLYERGHLFPKLRRFAEGDQFPTTTVRP